MGEKGICFSKSEINRIKPNQVPHLTQDTSWESDKKQENITYKRAKRPDAKNVFVIEKTFQTLN